MPRSNPTASDAFASLLDAQARDVPLNAAAGPRQARVMQATYVEGVPVEPAASSDSVAESLSRIYDVEKPAPAAPSEPLSCDPEVIARELGLAPALSAAELESIRRNFALANHPDRAPPSLSHQATRRMSLANMLIDQALRDRRKPAPR